MADAASLTGTQEAPSYAHPTAALFLVLFKFSALFYYVLCGLFGTGYIINFCVVNFLLVCDFWTVREAPARGGWLWGHPRTAVEGRTRACQAG